MSVATLENVEGRKPDKQDHCIKQWSPHDHSDG
jgi:hypothetical protein